MSKSRLDQYLFDHGYAESREKAKAIIMSGAVFLNGRRVDKPGLMISDSDQPEVHGKPLKYVSRGGLKLEKALQVFPVDPSGMICIDCGASTGGFTDVLLQAGASRVYAVDVGYGQLAWKLRNDDRVINLERLNVRYLAEEQIPEKLDLAVMDVSFISIRLILPVVKEFLKPGADYICLIKPQFEAGREYVGKKGVVRDPAVHRQVIDTCLHTAKQLGYRIMGLDWSPIRGPEGNVEFLCWLKNEIGPDTVLDIDETVRMAHAFFKE
ncbi:MAG: TlyA family RNA methyltransferase [Oscillospiraceae bacterium]|nr:TlyA family RNA methyltransferase [Oscillospiraceae bacterium]MBR0392168.1 TlyA family RNA methyltransferase [Oscillospiraceae bacterium]